MSRKDYRAFAAIVADQRAAARRKTGYPAEAWAVLEATRDMAVAMADVFRGDSAAFDRGRFYDACGIADVNTTTGEAADR